MGTSDESPMDEVTDLIASVEMHRKEIEKESGLEASRNYALRRLQQALLEQQEASQTHGTSAARAATAQALALEIKRIESLAQSASPRPAAKPGRPQQQQRQHMRHDAQRGIHKNRGRRTMGRNSGR